MPTETVYHTNQDIHHVAQELYASRFAQGYEDGDIISKFETHILAAYFLTRPDLQSYFIKTMQLELPTDKQALEHTLCEPINSVQLLIHAVMYAVNHGIPGQVVIDHFATQFEHGALQHRSKQELRSIFLTAAGDHFKHSDFQIQITDHRPKTVQPKHVFSGIIHRNVNLIADGIPRLPLNYFRYHDHRKGMLFDVRNEGKIFLLQNGNFAHPIDYDLALLIKNPEIIQQLIFFFNQSIPQNGVCHGNGWTVYQDGGPDLDPQFPLQSSPTLKRIHSVLKDPETKELVWCSQFLPDTQDLSTLAKQLQSGNLDHITVHAPHFSKWSPFYMLSGGLKSLLMSRKLGSLYPHRYHVNLTTQNYLHAKFIRLNNETLLFGSHNFNRSLVQAHTSEITLELERMSNHTKRMLETAMKTFI